MPQQTSTSLPLLQQIGFSSTVTFFIYLIIVLLLIFVSIFIWVKQSSRIHPEKPGKASQISGLASDPIFAFVSLIILTVCLIVILILQIIFTSNADTYSKIGPGNSAGAIILIKIAWAGLCPLPPLIMIFVSSIAKDEVQVNQIFNVNSELDNVADRLCLPAAESKNYKQWFSAFKEMVEANWTSASDRAEIRRGTLYTQGLLFGCIVFLIMSHCLIIFNFQWENHLANTYSSAPELKITKKLVDHDIMNLTLAVLISAMAYFCISLGRIIIRIAQRDVSDRTMAWAIRGLFMVIIATALLAFFNQNQKHLIGDSYAAYILMGGFVAVLGEQALQIIADKIGKLLGFPSLQLEVSSDLGQLIGINELETLRLAEETIGSIHSLAFAPTSRLYFSMPFSLSRICDWQDQALLYECFGPVRAKQLQEQYLVRGAISAQALLAGIFLSENVRCPQNSEETDNRTRNNEALVNNEAQAKLISILGFSSLKHATIFTRELLYNDHVAKLLVYVHGTVVPSGQTSAQPKAPAA